MRRRPSACSVPLTAGSMSHSPIRYVHRVSVAPSVHPPGTLPGPGGLGKGHHGATAVCGCRTRGGVDPRERTLIVPSRSRARWP